MIRLILLGISLTSVGLITTNVHFNDKIAEIEDKHQQNITSLDTKWQQEKLKKQKEYRAELEAKWGDKVAVAVKDPNLSIDQMLWRSAVASCKECQKVVVKVDNFTEFDVFFYVDKPLDSNTSAKIIKAFLEHTHRYTNSVSFVYKNYVVKAIDKQNIDSIQNWSSVSFATIAGKMYSFAQYP